MNERAKILRKRRAMALGVGAALAAVTTLFFCFFADQVWEDFFITFKFSQNLCEGKGLVYYAGERVHGFTSPLGTLLPALCYWATGQTSYAPALWLFRLLFCVPAFVLGGVLLMKAAMKADKRRAWPAAALGILYAFEGKSVAFSVNGMETALMLMFLAWAVYLLSGGGLAAAKNWLWMGLAWSGLMWTRPDSCVYVTVIALAALAIDPNRKATARAIVKAALVTTVLYLPWFVWAWAYYGTPVPHTITAKGSDMLAGGLVSRLWTALLGVPSAALSAYATPYAAFSECSPATATGAVVCGLFGVFYWLVPVRDRLGRASSLMFFLTCFYLAFMPRAFPWYYPPAAALGLVATVRGVSILSRRFIVNPVLRERVSLYALIATGALLVQSFVVFACQQRIQQREIETGNRRQIGEWLKTQVRPGDRVYLECLGYIGYFSGARILDWPGLISPEVVRARKEKGVNRFSAVAELRPEWVVARFYEWFALLREPYFVENYDLAAIFDVWKKLAAYRFIPAEKSLPYDGFFLVFRKKDPTRPFEPVDLDRHLRETQGYGLRELFAQPSSPKAAR